jgi:hypothetical protein
MQSSFTRQATILRKNLMEWDNMMRHPQGEDWPKMLGRLNAALNQTNNMDKSIDDVMEHFVYVPRQSTANPQDIPFFLSTRIEMSSDNKSDNKNDNSSNSPEDSSAAKFEISGDPVHLLAAYENNAARIASEYEENMIRF